MSDIGRDEYAKDRKDDAQARADVKTGYDQDRADDASHRARESRERGEIREDIAAGKTRARLGAAILVATALLAVISIANQVVEAHRSQQIGFNIRQSQYDGCVTSGNVLRNQVRNEFVDLKRSVLIPVFSQISATLPPRIPAKAILDNSVDYLHHRIKTIADRIPDADCMSIYPPLDGQTFNR